MKAIALCQYRDALVTLTDSGEFYSLTGYPGPEPRWEPLPPLDPMSINVGIAQAKSAMHLPDPEDRRTTEKPVENLAALDPSRSLATRTSKKGGASKNRK